MRRKEKQIEDQETLNEILSQAVICRVALFDEEYPYIVPMNYGYADGALYFHSATEGKKLDLIRKNNKASFEIEKSHEIIKHEVSCKWSTRFCSIIGRGTFEIISDFEEKKKGLDIIMQQHGKAENEYNDKLVDRVMILKLSIVEMTGKQSAN